MRYRVASPQAIHETIDGEVVAINLSTGAYYSLRHTGAEAWALLGSGMSVAAASRTMARRYDVGPEGVEEALSSLADRLRQEGLLAPVPDDGDGAAGPDLDPLPPGATFVPPVLEKFDDMQDLILLDPVHEVDEGKGWPHPTGN
jgi:hypothetical protein